MREIEFRAFLKKEKKMVEVEEINFIYEEVRFKDYETSFTKPIEINVSFNDIELMQYVGIKDKNGKKIFEDDIVRFTTGTYTSIGYVEFYNGMFQVVDIEDDECTEILCYCDELEVLGNCWDNLELLEVE